MLAAIEDGGWKEKAIVDSDCVFEINKRDDFWLTFSFENVQEEFLNYI